MSHVQPVTIVCVYNNEAVRTECLDTSIELLRHEMPTVQYVPVDNTLHQFSSAGAALNHGASQAVHEFVVFAHQDVYLHSLTALGRAAEAMRDGDIGLTGAVGVAVDGSMIGRIRDRVVLTGSSARLPIDVDSLDEVLFLTTRSQILAEPLSESAEFAWHAYAVEYGLRMRSLGKRVVVSDLPLTHNSMTTNLARLDEAHHEVGQRYPSALPLRTTCGTIRPPSSGSALPRALTSHRWRFRWALNSIRARRVQSALGSGPVVLNDIRREVDSLLPDGDAVLPVISLDSSVSAGDPLAQMIRLRRGDRAVEFSVADRSSVARRIQQMSDPAESLLITNVSREDLRQLRRALQRHPKLIGYHEDLDCWVLVGNRPDTAIRLWQGAASVPFLMCGG